MTTPTIHPRGYYGYAIDNSETPRLMWCERIGSKAGHSWWVDFTGTETECQTETGRRNHEWVDANGIMAPSAEEVVGQVPTFYAA